MNYKELSQKIQQDIDNGVYSQFPKLLRRLQFIGDKLIKKHYCPANDDLSRGELLTLKENDYTR